MIPKVNLSIFKRIYDLFNDNQNKEYLVSHIALECYGHLTRTTELKPYLELLMYMKLIERVYKDKVDVKKYYRWKK